MESPRPQSLLLTLLALHLLGSESGSETGTGAAALSVGSVLDVLGPLGAGDGAVRSTVARMTAGGLLTSHRRGRSAYVSLTPRLRDVLVDGRRRMWKLGPVDHDWDGRWTVVAFSLPESAGAERHALRSRLTWAGFGLLQSGLWIAPGTVDVGEVATDGGAGLTVLSAAALSPTTAPELSARAFDTGRLAAGYLTFLRRWDRPRAEQPRSDLDPLRRQLLLHTDWLALVRRDPRLPAELLPHDWPALQADRLVRRIDGRLDPAARRLAVDLLARVAV